MVDLERRKNYRIAAEIARHENDGLAMIRALDTQVPILKSTASELVVLGGNRSSKTFTAAAKFAAIARNKVVHGPDGEEIPQRLPWQENRPLLMWAIGLGWNHIGDTIWRVLFRPGLYKIIRDQETLRWRTFNPKLDEGRESEIRPSFPLIPMSEVKGGLKGIGWENLKERQFSHIELTNGTIIKAYASTGEVKMGDPVDVIWIDERIDRTGHYAEWQARLSDTKGRIIWSSVSDMDPALLRLHKRAVDQEREVKQGVRKKADVEYYVLRFSANPFIDDEEKRKRIESWDADERKMRDEGEFLIGNIRIYPMFNRDVHCAIYHNPEEDDELSRVLRANNGVPPADWTRELILDPGTVKPALLFCAIPPRRFWGSEEPYFVPYDEIFIPRQDAEKIAKRTKAKSGDHQFQRFIIDGQAARQTPMGFSMTIGQNYSKAFRKENLLCIESGSAFTPGDPNWQSSSMIIEHWLAVRTNGRPLLRIVTERCPNLVEQIENNLKAIEKGPSGETWPMDKPAKGQVDDLRRCLEYWGSRSPRYVEPPKVSKDIGGPGLREFEAIEKRFGPSKSPDDGVVHLGPGLKGSMAWTN